MLNTCRDILSSWKRLRGICWALICIGVRREARAARRRRAPEKTHGDRIPREDHIAVASGFHTCLFCVRGPLSAMSEGKRQFECLDRPVYARVAAQGLGTNSRHL